MEGGSAFPSYFVEKKGRKKCWKCGVAGRPWKNDCININQVIALILTLSNHVQGLTKQSIIIQINPSRPKNYIIVWNQAMVTHATSYEVLVGRKVFIFFKGYFKLINKIYILLMVDTKQPYGFVAN